MYLGAHKANDVHYKVENPKKKTKKNSVGRKLSNNAKFVGTCLTATSRIIKGREIFVDYNIDG